MTGKVGLCTVKPYICHDRQFAQSLICQECDSAQKTAINLTEGFLFRDKSFEMFVISFFLFEHIEE